MKEEATAGPELKTVISLEKIFSFEARLKRMAASKIEDVAFISFNG